MTINWRALATVALLASGAQSQGAAYQPNLAFNITLPAESPMVEFFPDYGRQNLTSPAFIWHDEWSGISANSTYRAGMIGLGTLTRSATQRSYQVDEFAKDWSIAVSGYLTRVIVYGRLNGTVRADLQGKPLQLRVSNIPGRTLATDPEQGILCSAEGWDPGYNRINVEPYGYLGLVKVTDTVIQTGMVTQAPTFNDVVYTVERFVTNNKTINPFFNTTGTTWNISTHIGGIGGQAEIPYLTAVGNWTSTVTFDVPDNTTYMFLNGTVSPFSGNWEVTITERGKPDVSKPAPGSAEGMLRIPMYNRMVAPTILNAVALDPGQQYSMKIALPVDEMFGGVFTPEPGKVMDGASLHSVTFYSALWTAPNNTTNENKTDTTDTPNTRASEGKSGNQGGKIAGAVIGSVVGVGLLGGLAFILWRRRSRPSGKLQDDAQDDGSFEIDPAAAPTPYTASPTMQNAMYKSVVGGTTPLENGGSTPPEHASGPSTPRRQAVDGGALDEETIPPEYNPAWATRRTATLAPLSLTPPPSPKEFQPAVASSPMSPLEAEVKRMFR